MFNKVLLNTLLAVFAIFASTSSIWAAGYPSTQIQIICPFGAGGAGDVAARYLAAGVKNDFNKPVVVVNKPGGAGVVGTTVALNSKADGHTLLIGRVANAGIIPALNKTISYKWDDFTYLGLLDLNPIVFVVKKDSPYKTMKDLADAIKANPGKLSFGGAGALNIAEVAAYMFVHAIGMDKSAAVSLPFPSDAAGKNAILGGHATFGALNLSACIDQLHKDGQLRALAVTTDARIEKLPDVPTVREAGYPELENVLGWDTLCAPKGISKEVIEKWTKALEGLKTNQEWLTSERNSGAIPYLRGPAETEAFVRTQIEKFTKLGEALGLSITK